jgi:predicted transcriptional regulator
MKDRILALLAKRPFLSNVDLVAELGSSQSRMSYYLGALHREGLIKCKNLAHGKKLWRLTDGPKVEIAPYEIEKTLWRVKEIPSLFIAV